MHVGGVLRALAMTFFALACAEREAADIHTGDSTAFELDVRARGTLDRIGNDSLLSTVQITALFPEPDGEAIPVLFADTGRNVTAGLAIIDARSDAPQLLWPDSVTRVWWSGDHALTFTTATGRGAYVIVDIHRAMVDSLVISSPVPAPPVDTMQTARLGRAQRHIDSLRAQPAGETEPGTLEYTVTHWIPDPSGRFAAFHATARDSAAGRVNPAWYISDIASGVIKQIELVIGRAQEMPADAGGWTDDLRFLYAKGASVHEVRIRENP